MHVMRASRRRFTAFWEAALVSNQICPSITAYHMATRWGRPVGPIVAMVAVRLRSTNPAISSSVIVICARWFPAMPGIMGPGPRPVQPRARPGPARRGCGDRTAPSSRPARRAGSAARARPRPARRGPARRCTAGREDGGGAEGDRLDDVGPGAHAGVERGRGPPRPRRRARRQGVEGGDGPVDLAAAVVGHHEAVDPGVEARPARRRGAGCPSGRSAAPSLAQPRQVVPRQRGCRRSATHRRIAAGGRPR